MCWEYDPECENRFPHLPHSNGFSPVCNRLCSAKWCLCLNAFEHRSQTNGLIPECSYLWRAREDCLLNCFSHWSHGNIWCDWLAVEPDIWPIEGCWDPNNRSHRSPTVVFVVFVVVVELWSSNSFSSSSSSSRLLWKYGFPLSVSDSSSASVFITWLQ